MGRGRHFFAIVVWGLLVGQSLAMDGEPIVPWQAHPFQNRDPVRLHKDRDVQSASYAPHFAETSSRPAGPHDPAYDIDDESQFAPFDTGDGRFVDEPCDSIYIHPRKCARGQFITGFTFTFLSPHFGDNVAFTTTESNGTSFDNITSTQFSYGLQTAPRVWIEYVAQDGLGLRAQYWQFHHGAPAVSGAAPSNGFGLVETPSFGNLQISTSIPGSTLSATSGLELQAFDIEGTKGVSFGRWTLAASAGLRVASFQQNYQAELQGPTAVLQDTISLGQSLTGAGPTFAIEGRRNLLYGLSLFSTARGSLVFGNRHTELLVGEDIELSSAFHTNQPTSTLDTVPIADMQLGVDWMWPPGSLATLFFRTAMEAQWWQGIGNATSTTGSVGLFGFNATVGLAW